MKILLPCISFGGLALMLTAAVLAFNGVLDKHDYYLLAFIGTIAWFATVPFWMKRRLHHK